MPMEHIRKRLAGDVDLYPEFGGCRKANQPEVLSIASSSSSSSEISEKASFKPTTLRKRNIVVISSDEEKEEDEVVAVIPPQHSKSLVPRTDRIPLQPRAPTMFQPPKAASSIPPSKSNSYGVPIPIPANRNVSPGSLVPPLPIATLTVEDDHDGEEIDVPEFKDVDPFMSAGEADKALQDMMGGSMNGELGTDVEIDMSQAIVEGFKPGIKLLPHQVLGRTWMKEREDVTKKRSGGILADDMGLGKTIQTLTRIVDGRARKSDKADGWSASTLVICPLALVGQWADEIEKMTNLRVLKHQGTARTSDSAVLEKYHVIVTTYDTVKSEHESFMPSKDESKPKAKSKAKPANSDYDDSESESFEKKKSKSKARAKKHALYGVRWWRIVLDEAHNIKNPKTKGALACCALEGKFKWCLTGTPVQNNVTELYSLLKFLYIKPLHDWTKFNVEIAKPLNTGRGAGRAMKRLQVVLCQIMLRRRKDQIINGKALIELPKRTVNVVSCVFDASEKNFYDSLETKMESVVEKLMATNKGKNNYISVLLLLLRLRQACNHPILVAEDYKKDLDAVDPKAVAKGQDDKEADGDDLVTAFGQMGVTRKCQMCTTELNKDNAGAGEWSKHCRDCVHLAKEAQRAERDRPSSAKIRMILQLLKEIDERSESEEKTIVFSQFTSMLDLIEPFLSEKGINYVRYDGSMNTKDREASLAKIKSSSSTRVILISFKAGSTGLNLTACNNVILVDLWWNPALEDQAFDRSHRFGQTRDVNIFKLKIDDTVEDRILLLQDKKRALAAATLSGDKLKPSDMRLGMDDLLELVFKHGERDDELEEDF